MSGIYRRAPLTYTGWSDIVGEEMAAKEREKIDPVEVGMVVKPDYSIEYRIRNAARFFVTCNFETIKIEYFARKLNNRTPNDDQLDDVVIKRRFERGF